MKCFRDVYCFVARGEDFAKAYVTDGSARRDGVCYKRECKLNEKGGQYKGQGAGVMRDGEMEMECFQTR